MRTSQKKKFEKGNGNWSTSYKVSISIFDNELCARASDLL